jgi:GNAT superfamily N-acetyltransferase
MLAVRPDAQGRGLGGRLIAEAEARAARAGASVMDIKVVNLRTDLLPRYTRMGYVATGTEPYDHRPVLQPCHFILMEKGLRGPA